MMLFLVPSLPYCQYRIVQLQFGCIHAKKNYVHVLCLQHGFFQHKYVYLMLRQLLDNMIFSILQGVKKVIKEDVPKPNFKDSSDILTILLFVSDLLRRIKDTLNKHLALNDTGIKNKSMNFTGHTLTPSQDFHLFCWVSCKIQLQTNSSSVLKHRRTHSIEWKWDTTYQQDSPQFNFHLKPANLQ